MSLTQRDPDTLGDVTAESALSFADEPVLILRQRLDRAFRYTVSWSAAAGDALDRDGVSFSSRIDDVQLAIKVMYTLIPPDSVFIGKDAKAAYERLSAGYAQLYRDLVFSAETLPQPALLEKLAGLGQALLDAPTAAITGAAESISNAIARVLGGTAAALWSNLWPWLLLAGAAGGVWIFRAPLARAVGKVAA